MYRGHAELRDWTAHRASAWESWEMDPAQYLDAGESVVMLFTMRTTGREAGSRWSGRTRSSFASTMGALPESTTTTISHQARVEYGLPK